MTAKELVISQFEEAQAVLESFMSQAVNYEAIIEAGDCMVEALRQGAKLLSCGNGGSLCDAMHFAEELTGQYRDRRAALPAIAIADGSHMTCTANDYSFEHIFSRYVEALGRPGDVLLAISTSGNSANVLKAAHAAKAQGMSVVALTGKSGGELAKLSNVEIRVPHDGTSDRIQEVHIKIIHCLILYIEQYLPAKKT